MQKELEKLKNVIISIGETSERELEELSEYIDQIKEWRITDERTISLIFDTILSIEFIEDNKKRTVFHILSNYCRSFDKKLADDYDKILEEDLNPDCNEELDNYLEYEKIPWYEEG